MARRFLMPYSHPCLWFYNTKVSTKKNSKNIINFKQKKFPEKKNALWYHTSAVHNGKKSICGAVCIYLRICVTHTPWPTVVDSFVVFAHTLLLYLFVLFVYFIFVFVCRFCFWSVKALAVILCKCILSTCRHSSIGGSASLVNPSQPFGKPFVRGNRVWKCNAICWKHICLCIYALQFFFYFRP